MNYCPNCGKPVDGKGQYCTNCGSRLTSVSVPPLAPPSGEPTKQLGCFAWLGISFIATFFLWFVRACNAVSQFHDSFSD